MEKRGGWLAASSGAGFDVTRVTSRLANGSRARDVPANERPELASHTLQPWASVTPAGRAEISPPDWGQRRERDTLRHSERRRQLTQPRSPARRTEVRCSGGGEVTGG